MKMFCSCLFFSLLLSLNACYRKELPPGVETDASLATADWLEQQSGSLNSPDVLKVINRVTARLAQTISGSALEKESFASLSSTLNKYPAWHTLVIRDANPNAFSLGAGMIVITEGLLRETRSEAELAAILSHEMSHQLLGHTKAALLAEKPSSQAPQYSYSLEREIEADSLGLKILKVARYDLRAALSAIQIASLTRNHRGLSEVVAPIPPDWLSERSAKIAQKIDESGVYLPATSNTREFSRMKKILTGSIVDEAGLE